MSWDQNLTTEQRNAVSFIGEHVRLLAGPGTGKTFSLTRRILFLITERQVPPERILVLTFTRAATAELISRVREALNENIELPHISTLHSFALQTILKSRGFNRLPLPIRIADDYEERWIIEEDIKRILSLNNISEAKMMLRQLSADWEQLTADLDDDWENNFINPQFIGAWREHRNIYGYILRSELVYQLKHLLEETDIDVASNYDHILIDEYQDLNACDLAVIRYLVNENELYIAGDDDQSIYGFRYANPEGIRRFNHEYTPSSSLTLEECKRCDKRILNLGLYVARQDPRRIEKALIPREDAEDGTVHILRFDDQVQEANNIAQLCRKLIENHDIAPSEILILLRADHNNQFSNLIRESLSDYNLPTCTVSNELEIFSEPEVRKYLCFLRLIINRADNLAWVTILNLRTNGIGKATISAIYEQARSLGITFAEVLFAIHQNPNLIARFGSKIKDEVEDILTIINSIQPQNGSDLTTYINYLSNELLPSNYIEQITSFFQRIIATSWIEDISGLLKVMNISMDTNEQDRDNQSINIMSMHQAKGLSADVVFIVAAEDEYIPGRATGEQVLDELRLLYVSLTRARHYLFITHCNNRFGAQMHSGKSGGQSSRHLTSFLSGGPIHSINGSVYVSNFE